MCFKRYTYIIKKGFKNNDVSYLEWRYKLFDIIEIAFKDV